MAMVAEEGKVTELHLFEERVLGEAEKKKSKKKPEAEAEEKMDPKVTEVIGKWHERDWLRAWAKLSLLWEALTCGHGSGHARIIVWTWFRGAVDADLARRTNGQLIAGKRRRIARADE